MFILDTFPYADNLNETLPSIQEELSSLVAEIEKERLVLRELEGKKTSAEEGEKSGRAMESDVRKMDDCLFELKEIDRKVRIDFSWYELDVWTLRLS